MAFALLSPSRHGLYDFISPTANLASAATGLSILVTGAGTGIGRAIACAFAQAGAHTITIAARRTEPLEKCKADIAALAPRCRVVVVSETDVSDARAVEALFSRTLRDGDGPPDILINNAAVSGDLVTVEDSRIDSWWGVQEINLKGMYLTTRAYLKLLQNTTPGKKGRIINISSNAAWRAGPGFSAYATSKCAVNRFSEFVDEENKTQSGTRCFALHPGGVAGTDMSSTMPEGLQKMLVDEPELAAGTCLYLAGKRADFLGGRFVSATWDMEELEKSKDRVVEEDLLKTRIVGVQ